MASVRITEDTPHVLMGSIANRPDASRVPPKTVWIVPNGPSYVRAGDGWVALRTDEDVDLEVAVERTLIVTWLRGQSATLMSPGLVADLIEQKAHHGQG